MHSGRSLLLAQFREQRRKLWVSPVRNARQKLKLSPVRRLEGSSFFLGKLDVAVDAVHVAEERIDV